MIYINVYKDVNKTNLLEKWMYKLFKHYLIQKLYKVNSLINTVNNYMTQIYILKSHSIK